MDGVTSWANTSHHILLLFRTSPIQLLYQLIFEVFRMSHIAVERTMPGTEGSLCSCILIILSTPRKPLPAYSCDLEGLSNTFRLGSLVSEAGLSCERCFYCPGCQSLHFCSTQRAPVAPGSLVEPVEGSLICLDMSNTFPHCTSSRLAEHEVAEHK